MARPLRSLRPRRTHRRRPEALLFIGAFWHHNNSPSVQEADYQMSIDGVGGANPSEWHPAGAEVAQAGDLCIMMRTANSAIDFDLTPDFVDIGADDIPTPSTTLGEYNRVAVRSKLLSQTDIDNGYIAIEANIRAHRDASLLIFRNHSSIIWSEAYNTAGSLNSSQVAIRQEMATDRAFALAAMWRGGGNRTTTLPDWTLVVDSKFTTSGVAAMALAIFMKEVGIGASPSGFIDVSGSDDMTLRTWTLLVQ